MMAAVALHDALDDPAASGSVSAADAGVPEGLHFRPILPHAVGPSGFVGAAFDGSPCANRDPGYSHRLDGPPQEQ
jgi:hypothetical protein